MDTFSAAARGMANAGRELKVFDWDQAARLISERKPAEASAGLAEDWEWTGGVIYRDGKPVPPGDTYTYLASNWATPELNMDGEVVACFRMQSETTGWDSSTYWPDSALALISEPT